MRIAKVESESVGQVAQAGDQWGRCGTELRLWDSRGSAPVGAQHRHPCGQGLQWPLGPMRLQDTPAACLSL